MKKKLFAAITAGAMLCGMLTIPVSAAESYQKGDVNMDGVVDVADAQLILDTYVLFFTCGECELTDAQIQLASITNRTTSDSSANNTIPLNISDAQVVLWYATDMIAKLPVPDNIETYYEQIIKKGGGTS